jgi:NTP pyrophosphatase (non-canonical NTP hydrolase)
MEFKEYQEKAHSTSLNTKTDLGEKIISVITLAKNIGLISEKTKKLYRDKNGVADDTFKEKISDEIVKIEMGTIYLKNTLQKDTELIIPILDADKEVLYPLLGLIGETGETAEKIIQSIVSKNTQEEEFKKEVTKEVGDILWYLGEICTKLNINLDDAAQKNIEKLFSRKDRNQIKGNGDNR